MESAGRAALACATEARSSYPGLFAFQPGCILSDGLAFFFLHAHVEAYA